METDFTLKNKLILIYFVSFMGYSISGTYIPIYLKSIGIGEIAIGTLLAIRPFVGFIAQPLWNQGFNIVNSKKNLLSFIYLICGLSHLLFFYSEKLNFIFFVIIFTAFFQSSFQTFLDVITLNLIQNKKIDFGMIRMMGTVGFAVMSIIAGFIVDYNIVLIFILYLIVKIISAIITFHLPNFKVISREKSTGKLKDLIKNKNFVMLLSFVFFMTLFSSYGNMYFSIYFVEIGGSKTILGISVLISILFEIPFLYFSDFFYKKNGIMGLMIFSSVMYCIRWFLIYNITNPFLLVIIQITHGLTFIIQNFALIMYIKDNIRIDQRLEAQSLNNMIIGSFTQILAGIIGGVIGKYLGYRNGYLLISILSITTLIISGLIYYKITSKSRLEIKQLSTQVASCIEVLDDNKK